MNQTKSRRGHIKGSLPLLNRVIKYMLDHYKWIFVLVIACILINAVTSVIGATFPQTLVDDYIEPMLSTGANLFPELFNDIIELICIMAAGIMAAYCYSRLMVNVSQGTMLLLRNELFSKMESLPIKYFDTHAHGDIMSVYTNDIDTLRQLISQVIPQTINSAITMIATLITMLVLNPALTVISILTAALMLFVTAKFTQFSAKYYIKQQHDLGAVDGYIEEMMDGQKVVKVFCHEEEAKAGFRRVNEELRQSGLMANTFANMLMPVNANIGWLSYAVVAIVGAILAINGLAGVTVGTVFSLSA